MTSPAYTLSLPRKIVFGWGRVQEAPEHILPLGKRILLITGRASQAASGALDQLAGGLSEAGAEVRARRGPGIEPAVNHVDAILEEDGPWGPEVVVGLGGGSVLDIAKAVAALVPNACGTGRRTADFLEGTGATQPLRRAPLPFVGVPTTAGTGSEATRNAVLSWPERKLKRSLRDERLVAAVAIVDPALTASAPPDVTASSGMDAVTQLIESYICSRANPVTDVLAFSAIPGAVRALPELVRGEATQAHRAAMSYAALTSGICLANAGLGIAHGIAPALGLLYGVPHGKACAVLLPFALEVNREAARAKLARIWRSLGEETADDDEAVSLLIRHVRGLCESFGIPVRLGELNVKAAELPELARYASTNSLSANPRPVTKPEVAELLREAL